MADSIHVNLHTHSSLSDGELSPEALASHVAGAGVHYAALTDHDSVDGLARFRAALEEHGIASVPGIELTTRDDGRLVHLLGYGFDPADPGLKATVASIRRAQPPDLHSIGGSLRSVSTLHRADDSGAGPDAAPDGLLDIEAGITLLHNAGGRVFLAHPLRLGLSESSLRDFVVRLRDLGLDGIEAINSEFTTDQQRSLVDLAAELDLPVSAGTDYHTIAGLGGQDAGVDMPHADWQRFRDLVLGGRGLAAMAEATPRRSTPADPTSSVEHPRFDRRPFILRVVLPTVAALGVLLVGLYGLILPSFEQTLVDRKRELIRELTNSAWSVLAAYEQDVQQGLLTREEAEAAAAGVVGRLRYGDDRLDYFWIQDTEPTMVMHPYRTDLEGEDLSGFTDPRGVAIFEEFAQLVETQEQGYVDYVWQWFDDSERLEPKESYVKGFEPWGWVIGTGLYVDDVRAEIEDIERDLVLASLAISGAIAILLLFVLQQSLRIERRREDAVLRLRDSRARYQALAEATTEGTLLVVEGRCRYANPTFMTMLGYSARQMELLELADVLPRSDDNRSLWDEFAATDADPNVDGFETAMDAVLRQADGAALECVVTLTPVVFGGQSGHILLTRDVAASSREGAADRRSDLLPGAFRARASRRGVFLDISPSARQLVERLGHAGDEQSALADCFGDPADYGRAFAKLLEEGELREFRLTGESGGAPALLLSATLVRDEHGDPAFVDGYLVDISGMQSEGAGAGLALERLESSPGFLHQSVASLAREALVVSLETPIGEVARRMTELDVTAALVSSDPGDIIGIVTDVDLRARAVAEEQPPDLAVQALMSAPLLRIDGNAPAYVALLRMEDRDVHHLVLDDEDGRPPRLLDRAVLSRWARHAPMALLRAVGESVSTREVARQVERSTPMAEALLGFGTRVELVTGLLTSVYDAATVRLLELAIDESGPPTAPFAYFAMGSQGRAEVTLRSDQDSGIVYDADSPLAAEYFVSLGRRVRDGLVAAGYTTCPGGVMASEPAWSRSASEWRQELDDWLRRPEPSQVTDLSVFLDLRFIHGSRELTRSLRQQVAAQLPEEQALLHQLARGALVFKPPMRLPGNIYLGGGAERGEIDLKDALQSLVAFARLFAVRYGLSATHTLDRIEELGDRQLISTSARDELREAYRFLMDMRLRSQLADVGAGRPPSSRVELASLNQVEQESMRQAFNRIAAAQKQVDADFPEGG